MERTVKRRKVKKSEDVVDTERRRDLHSRKNTEKSSFLRIVLWALVSLVAIVYLVIPTVFKTSDGFRRSLIFMNYVDKQFMMNVSNPQEYGLNCSQSSYISHRDVNLGYWNIAPESKSNPCELKINKDTDNIILYLHGNGGTRGGGHRTKLYKVLRQKPLDARIVAIDYRGYADSSRLQPSAQGVVEDARAAYEWLAEQVGYKNINIWGHSLGTGIAIHMMSQLTSIQEPKSLILDGAFSSILEGSRSYPLLLVYSFLPKAYFEFFFASAIRADPNIQFDSLSIIEQIKIPVMIIHAKDDFIVPYEHSVKLYEKLRKTSDNVTFVSFEKDKGYGHKHIHRDPLLNKNVLSFIKSAS